MYNIDSEEKAYFLGFLQTDGHLSRKRASIELNSVDSHILDTFCQMFGGKRNKRIRNTNFKDNCELSEWRINSIEFVEDLNRLGIPLGRKSKKVSRINVPKGLERHYIRGLFDGDGSVGITKDGFPFLGFVTASTLMKEYIEEFVGSLGVKSSVNRNKRDNVYSFSFFKEKAQKIIDFLYSNCSICLNRKKEKAKIALSWIRPDWCRIRPKSPKWTKEEKEILEKNNYDSDYILKNKLLDRSKLSIDNQKWKMEKGKKYGIRRKKRSNGKNDYP